MFDSEMHLFFMIYRTRSRARRGGMNTGSVINRMPSHSLSIENMINKCTLVIHSLCFHILLAFWSSTYNIVVAVPTNNNWAFSPPALVG